ncbi:DUF6252 family protein [Pedobacter agri]|uniref:DUF6252 family protein n=2 Tax=Pedobacter agri TaxID=454586 RepID=A0A9X3I8N8_9SPHI|nr:DUF6252 family protein [Pedobacter agri]MCX3264926.1 DUF6252 family protein [Pedobacter agri]
MFVLLVTILASSCKKDEVTNNFKCKVNGELWRPRNSDLKYGHDAEVHLIDEGKTFFVSAYQEGTRQTISFAIFLENEVRPGSHILNGIKNTAEYEDKSKNIKCTSQLGYTGKLQILTLDKKTKRVRGTFSFKAVDNNTKVVADISEGEFNLVYNTY